MGPKKLSTNLKYQLLEHIAGQAAKNIGQEKRFRDTDIALVDWTTVETVVKSQAINTRWWTTKFVTGFCMTGIRMTYQKQQLTADCPRCGTPQEDTTHILQCPQLESQRLWDIALLNL